MADQISCARCQHANPPVDRFCGWCGASLRASTDLMARREGSLTVMGHALPVKPGPIGKALAVGLGTLAMRAGISWLRHRTTADDRSSTLTTREYDTALSKYYLGQGIETILIQESGEFHPGRTIAWQAIRLIAATEQTAPSSRAAGGLGGRSRAAVPVRVCPLRTETLGYHGEIVSEPEDLIRTITDEGVHDPRLLGTL